MFGIILTARVASILTTKIHKTYVAKLDKSMYCYDLWVGYLYYTVFSARSWGFWMFRVDDDYDDDCG